MQQMNIVKVFDDINPIKLRLISVRLSLAQGYDNHPLKKVWGVKTQNFLPKIFLPPWRNGRALDFKSKGREIDPRREPGLKQIIQRV